MHFTIQREALLKPLQLVAGVVERRQTLPVLSNVLLVVEGQQLSLTGTDLEVELVGRVQLEEPAEPGEITVPARKLMDICKSLPNDALIDIKRVIHIGIVDKTFPTRGSTRLFKIHPHYDVQRVTQLFRQSFQTARVVQTGFGIVDGARADHHHQTMIFTVQNVL